MEDKLKQSENKIKLNNAKSELALARMEVDAWRRAKKEKDALVRKMASKSLQKVKAKLSNRIRIGMEKWKRFVAIHRREELQEVSKAAKKTTRDLSAYKAAIREEKKRRRQAEKSVKELTEQLKEARLHAASRTNDDGRETQRGQAEPGQRDGDEPFKSLKRTSSMTSNGSSLDDSFVGNMDAMQSQIEQLELDKMELERALEEAKTNADRKASSNDQAAASRKLVNENNRLKLQVERLTKECNRLIAEQKVKMQEFQQKLKGANVVSLEKYEQLKVMSEHYKSQSEEREQQVKELAEQHTTGKYIHGGFAPRNLQRIALLTCRSQPDTLCPTRTQQMDAAFPNAAGNDRRIGERRGRIERVESIGIGRKLLCVDPEWLCVVRCATIILGKAIVRRGCKRRSWFRLYDNVLEK